MSGLDIKPAINITRLLGFKITYLQLLGAIVLLTSIYLIIGMYDFIFFAIIYFILIYLALRDRIDIKKILIIFTIMYISGVLLYLSMNQYFFIIPLVFLIVLTFVIMQYLLAYLTGGLLSLIYLSFIFLHISQSSAWDNLFVYSLFIWIMGLGIFSYFITGATRRLFNITIRDMFSSLFMSWFYDDPAVEKQLTSIGKNIDVDMDVVVLKIGDDLVYMMFPKFHFGPFGSIGSADTPNIINTYFPNNLVFHGLCHHDRDICSRSQTEEFIRKIAMDRIEGFQRFRFKYKRYDKDSAKANVIFSDNLTIIGLTRYPEVTEDVRSGNDIILKSSLHPNIPNPIMFDQHDSDANVVMYFSSDSSEFEEYLGLMKKINLQEDLENAKGAYHKIYTLDAGVGSNGINILILTNGYQKLAIINIDGNGINRSSHERLDQICKKYSYIPIISTTDSHENNDISGIINDVDLSDYTITLIDEYLKDPKLQEVWYAYRKYSMEMCVLGEESSARLLTYMRVSTNFLMAMLVFTVISNIAVLMFVNNLNLL
ncbi:MAG: DUF2070 family protein [Candidatus Micrarchaeota archaeon]|nr:DUF2070 family protein [Candidatus Micrarchaeota archaeon]